MEGRGRKEGPEGSLEELLYACFVEEEEPLRRLKRGSQRSIEEKGHQGARGRVCFRKGGRGHTVPEMPTGQVRRGPTCGHSV